MTSNVQKQIVCLFIRCNNSTSATGSSRNKSNNLSYDLQVTPGILGERMTWNGNL